MEIALTRYTPENGVWTNAFVQGICALAAAGGGTLTVPRGEYRTGPITLCSNLTLVLEDGAFVRFLDSEDAFALVECQFEGRLEQRPQPCVGVAGAKNVTITGKGVLDGSGMRWWKGHKARTLSHGRPYLFHAEDCRGLTVRGVVLQNSPTWTLHPLRCEDVTIENVTVKNPSDSPNTDGINPESCKNVHITGCTVDVGDDCITLKAGTEETAQKVPCENITVSNCTLMHGHGGIVIGSEMSGGVKNVTVEHCRFINTDRGLRIKTHRGRGGIVEGLRFSDLTMDGVLCPFVINLYYCCHSSEENRHIWEKAPYSVTSKTPCVKNIHISRVHVKNAHACAGFLYGLPEMPIENVTIEDCTIAMALTPKSAYPAMTQGVDSMAGKGFFMRNIIGLRLEHVQVLHNVGEMYDRDASVHGG